MAKNPDNIPLQKHTLNLYEGDYDRLQDLFPDAGGAGVVVRRAIRALINRIEASAKPHVNLEVDL